MRQVFGDSAGSRRRRARRHHTLDGYEPLAQFVVMYLGVEADPDPVCREGAVGNVVVAGSHQDSFAADSRDEGSDRPGGGQLDPQVR
jgi:hypothetical protein